MHPEQDLFIALGAQEALQCIRLLPAFLQGDYLGNEFCIHQSAAAGLDGQCFLAIGGAFLGDARTHFDDLKSPIR